MPHPVRQVVLVVLENYSPILQVMVLIVVIFVEAVEEDQVVPEVQEVLAVVLAEQHNLGLQILAVVEVAVDKLPQIMLPEMVELVLLL